MERGGGVNVSLCTVHDNRNLQIWLRVRDKVRVQLFKSSLRGLDNRLSQRSCFFFRVSLSAGKQREGERESAGDVTDLKFESCTHKN